MGSSRLPGKTLMKIGQLTLIEHVINRSQSIEGVDEYCLATTFLPSDDLLVNFVKRKFPEIGIFRGDPQNVRSRFEKIGFSNNADIMLRVTADDPFKDPKIASECLTLLKVNRFDYINNYEPPCLPVGMDVECFNFHAFVEYNQRSAKPDDVEHVTTALKNLTENKGNWYKEPIFTDVRLTVDYQTDLDFCTLVAEEISFGEHAQDYTWQHTINAIRKIRSRG